MKTTRHMNTLAIAGSAILFSLTTACGGMENSGPGGRTDSRSDDADDGASSVERTAAIAAVYAGVGAEVQAAVAEADPDLTFPDGSCITSSENSSTSTTYTLTDCSGAFGNATASGTITTEIVTDMLPVLEFEVTSQNLTINGESATLEGTVTYDTATSAVEVVTGGSGPRRMGTTTLSFTVDSGCATLSGAYQTTSREGGVADVTLNGVEVCQGECLPETGSASATLSGGRLSDPVDVTLSFTGMNTAQWTVDAEMGELTATCTGPSQ